VPNNSANGSALTGTVTRSTAWGSAPQAKS
jgi:hypothetical protein